MAFNGTGKFQINGGALIAAKSIKQTFESLASEDSGRSDDGAMHIEWIKRKLRKWEIELPPCTAAEAYAVINAVQGQVYNITIYDLSNSSGECSNVSVYTSNSAADCYSGVVRNGLYQGVSFSAIEMG